MSHVQWLSQQTPLMLQYNIQDSGFYENRNYDLSANQVLLAYILPVMFCHLSDRYLIK